MKLILQALVWTFLLVVSAQAEASSLQLADNRQAVDLWRKLVRMNPEERGDEVAARLPDLVSMLSRADERTPEGKNTAAMIAQIFDMGACASVGAVPALEEALGRFPAPLRPEPGTPFIIPPNDAYSNISIAIANIRESDCANSG